MAFNIERRSKTPNILQSIPFTNQMHQQQQQQYGQQGNARSSANLTSLNNQYGQHQHQYQQPLRSKTPTNDRLLFQHSQSLNTPNDYIYLNGQPAANLNNTHSAVYTSTSFSARNNNNKQLDPATVVDIEHHIPIYEQQQQRSVQKYANVCNGQAAAQYQTVNRSKTPGPETIYFRNGAPPMEPTHIAGSGYVTRSKTPTADMYYPAKTSLQQSVRIMEPNGSISTASPQILADSSSLPPYDIDDLLMLVLNHDNVSLITDVDGNYFLEMTIDLTRQETGFGFRIVGGEEENSQVSVGYIVERGSAHIDGRLRSNDEIIMIDNECVLGATHRRVVQLMTIAGLNRRVKLMIRRKLNFQQYKILLNAQQQQLKSRYMSNLNSSNSMSASRNMLSMNGSSPAMNPVNYPYTVTLFRNSNEGFGFIIISTDHGPKGGPSIGKLKLNSYNYLRYTTVYEL
jgi:hypothetical protein